MIPLTFLALLFLCLSYIYHRATRPASTNPSAPHASLDRLRRIPFLVLFSLTMIIFLHGFSTLKITFILLVNFFIAKFTCSPTSPNYLGPALTWAFNSMVLYANEIHGGYRFSQLHPSLGMLVRHVTMAAILFQNLELPHGQDLFGLDRTRSMGSTLGGTYPSTLRCYVWCRSIWITTGLRILHMALSKHVYFLFTPIA